MFKLCIILIFLFECHSKDQVLVPMTILALSVAAMEYASLHLLHLQMGYVCLSINLFKTLIRNIEVSNEKLKKKLFKDIRIFTQVWLSWSNVTGGSECILLIGCALISGYHSQYFFLRPGIIHRNVF